VVVIVVIVVKPLFVIVIFNRRKINVYLAKLQELINLLCMLTLIHPTGPFSIFKTYRS
jgi:hypothetical protein